MVEVERTTSLAAPKAPATSMAAPGADVKLNWAAVTQDASGKSTAVNTGPSALSNRTGKFSFGLTKGQ